MPDNQDLTPAPDTTHSPADLNWWRMLTDPDHLRNPYPELRRLQEMAPVHYDPASDVYFVLGYREFAQMARAPEMGRDTRGWSNGWSTEQNRQRDPVSYLLFDEFQRQMVNANPPDHRRMRTVYEKSFRSNPISAAMPMIEAECKALIAGLPAGTPVEFMTGFANVFPRRVSRNLFEIPPSMDDCIARWNNALLKIGDILMTPDQKQEAYTALREFKAYIRDFLASRQDNPGDGLIGLSISAMNEGVLDEEETVNNLVGLISGNETTVTLLGNGLLSLLTHPEEMQALRANRDLLRSAIEEMLRYEPGINFILRVAIQDFQCGGQRIPAGALAIGLVGAINRDPERFDNPAAFDIRREPNPHAIFGGGAHVCIGSSLARLEAQVGFTALLDHFPHIELAGDPIWWADRTNQRGLQHLPIRLYSH